MQKLKAIIEPKSFDHAREELTVLVEERRKQMKMSKWNEKHLQMKGHFKLLLLQNRCQHCKSTLDIKSVFYVWLLRADVSDEDGFKGGTSESACCSISWDY